jgi:hypothetical protein
MKFSCESPQEARERLEQWHRFFAVWPRQVGPRDCRALEWIERRAIYWDCSVGSMIEWKYREAQPRPVRVEPSEPWPRKREAKEAA